MLYGVAILVLAVAVAVPLWARSRQRSSQRNQPPPARSAPAAAARRTPRQAPTPRPDSRMGRVLQLGLWQLRDPVALAWTVALALGVLVVVLATPDRSVAHGVALAGSAPALASLSASVATRRRISGKRWSVEPPPDSRPAAAVERARQRREAHLP
ncbi:MAG: hypothetical protein R2694_07670 [Ilumatobacteraceae bacterium]